MFFLLFLIIISCTQNNSINSFEKISDSDKKLIISCIELVDSSYYFNSELAKKKGLSTSMIKRMNNEIEDLNEGIAEAKKLPNSTIELVDPKTLDLDSLFQSKE